MNYEGETGPTVPISPIGYTGEYGGTEYIGPTGLPGAEKLKIGVDVALDT